MVMGEKLAVTDGLRVESEPNITLISSIFSLMGFTAEPFAEYVVDDFLFVVSGIEAINAFVLFRLAVACEVSMLNANIKDVLLPTPKSPPKRGLVEALSKGIFDTVLHIREGAGLVNVILSRHNGFAFVHLSKHVVGDVGRANCKGGCCFI